MLPTITHIHMSVIPVLAGGGTLFLDSRAHKTIYDGCALAAARGATSSASRTTTSISSNAAAPSATGAARA